MQLIDYIRNLKQPERLKFAEKAETSYGYLLQIAYGNRMPHIDMAIKIKTATRGSVTLEDLRPDWYAAIKKEVQAKAKRAKK